MVMVSMAAGLVSATGMGLVSGLASTAGRVMTGAGSSAGLVVGTLMASVTLKQPHTKKPAGSRGQPGRTAVSQSSGSAAVPYGWAAAAPRQQHRPSPSPVLLFCRALAVAVPRQAGTPSDSDSGMARP